MKPFAATLFLATARAQDCAAIAVSAIPVCAKSCFLESASTLGCLPTDLRCQCAGEAALYAAVEGCVAGACGASDFERIIDGASSVCECATAGAGVARIVTVSGSGSMAVSTIPASAPVSARNSTSGPTSSRPGSTRGPLTAASVTATTTTRDAGGGTGGGDGGIPTTSPSFFATASVVSSGQHPQGPPYLTALASLIMVILAAMKSW